MSSIVTADLLADPQALADYRKVPFDETDFHAVKMLEVASAFIRSRTGQHISVVEGDVQELRGSWGGRLWLPQRPVIDVASIEVRDCGTTEFVGWTGYTVSRRGLITQGTSGNSWPGEWTGGWGGNDATIRVTYDHGYDPIPADIVGVCLSLASRRYGDASGGTLQSETIIDYSYTRGTGADGSPLGLTTEEAEVLEHYAYAENW